MFTGEVETHRRSSARPAERTYLANARADGRRCKLPGSARSPRPTKREISTRRQYQQAGMHEACRQPSKLCRQGSTPCVRSKFRGIRVRFPAVYGTDMEPRQSLPRKHQRARHVRAFPFAGQAAEPTASASHGPVVGNGRSSRHPARIGTPDQQSPCSGADPSTQAISKPDRAPSPHNGPYPLTRGLLAKRGPTPSPARPEPARWLATSRTFPAARPTGKQARQRTAPPAGTNPRNQPGILPLPARWRQITTKSQPNVMGAS